MALCDADVYRMQALNSPLQSHDVFPLQMEIVPPHPKSFPAGSNIVADQAEHVLYIHKQNNWIIIANAGPLIFNSRLIYW